MKGADVIRYPVPGVTLHRVVSGQRSQGDGEEQIPTHLQSPEADKTMQVPNKPAKGPGEVRQEKAIGETDRKEHVSTTSPPAKNDEDGMEDNQQVKNNLPEIIEIANKLTKVSIMSSPDSQLLNSAPKDLDKKKKIFLVVPKNPLLSLHKSKGRPASQGRSGGKREPRFVPYEPYKGCVKPILLKKKKKKRTKIREYGSQESLKSEGDGNAAVTASVGNAEQRTAEKLSILVRDFETERASWEEKVSNLTADRSRLEEQLTLIKKDKSHLEGQLSVQSQVNTELKRLLVASVGEEVQGRVQCLTEDKARMATMIRHYSEKVDRDYEEKERIGIQCDVWRSKFLASSMMVDELVGMRVALSRKLEEADEALRVLLAEHNLAWQHTLNMYKMNKQLREAFDPLAAQSGGVPPLSSADLVTLAVQGNVLAETVRDRLLGELGRSVGCGLSLDGLETLTPGQKMARQLVCQLEGGSSGSDGECSTVCPGRPALLHRFHPNTRYEHLTVNCCAHCNGEIKVV